PAAITSPPTALHRDEGAHKVGHSCPWHPTFFRRRPPRSLIARVQPAHTRLLFLAGEALSARTPAENSGVCSPWIVPGSYARRGRAPGAHRWIGVAAGPAVWGQQTPGIDGHRPVLRGRQPLVLVSSTYNDDISQRRCKSRKLVFQIRQFLAVLPQHLAHPVFAEAPVM